MSFFQSTYHSKVYRDFKEIENAAFRDVIRFYEEHENEIQMLEFGEYFEMLVAYTDALFEVGSYKQHLLMVNVVVESSILQNIKFFKEKDIYKHSLFRKAASHFNLNEYREASHILKELLKMSPEEKDIVNFLKKSMRRQQPRLVRNTRAASIFLFLLATFVVCLEVLLVQPFFDFQAPIVEATRNALFAVGGISLIGGDLLHRYDVEKQINEMIEAIKAEEMKQES